MKPFVARRRVEFADTDMAGIVHFSRFFVFMETAEHALRRHLGFEVHEVTDGVPIGWPRVGASCDYKSPARFGDELDLEVSVLALGTSSVTFGVRFQRGETLLAEGRMTSVCCRLAPDVKPVPIPAALAERLAEHRKAEP
ncbi:MAG: thioesterase family protein [Thermoanaerobaculia bacterium]|nr:thioesterase family protein [Thermoanaerobaculia bacterium]